MEEKVGGSIWQEINTLYTQLVKIALNISVREMDFTMKWTKGIEKGFTLKGHQMA